MAAKPLRIGEGEKKPDKAECEKMLVIVLDAGDWPFRGRNRGNHDQPYDQQPSEGTKLMHALSCAKVLPEVNGSWL